MLISKVYSNSKIVSMADIEDNTISSGRLEHWKTRWSEDKLRWHKYEINPYLIKYMSRLTEVRNDNCDSIVCADGNKKSAEKVKDDLFVSKNVFVPLCGKTKDLAYLLSIGHKVFAVEGVLEAIQKLEEENSFDLKFDEKESIYYTEDGRLRIYYGNIFQCPIEKWGPFDCIWDRASITAIEMPFRPAYKTIMRKSVEISRDKYHNFRYLLQTVKYDKSKSDGRGPKCVDDKDMEEIFGDWTKYELLETIPLPVGHIIRKIADIGLICDENIYLLSPKD